MRAQEFFGVWGLGHSRQGGSSGGTGVSSLGKSCAKNAACRGWSSPILCDGSVDRPSRRQTSMCGGGAFNVVESCVRNARYRLRGVRVGEASNPGPPQTRNRPRDVAEDILASMEHDLTHIDSDDEPLVLPTVMWSPDSTVAVLQVGSKMWESSQLRQIQQCLWIQICRCRHETVCWMHSNMIWCARV